MSEPQPRPAEPSVGEDQLSKAQSDDADMAGPDNDRRRPRESLGEERETKRVVKKVMSGWRPKRNGCEFTVVPGEIYSLPTILRVDPS